MKEENIIEPTSSNLGKRILTKELSIESDKIESVSSIYQKIDDKYRFKITIVISKEEHYEDA